MALPTLERTWQITPNVRITAAAEVTFSQNCLYEFKEAFIGFATLPWTVVGSSDGSVAALDAVDRWTTPGDITFSTGAGQSWMVLENASGNQLCIYVDTSSISTEDIPFYFSPSANFSGGTTSARPTATDEFEIHTTISQWLGGRNPPGTNDFIWQFWHSTDGQATRWVMFETGTPLVCGFIEPIDQPRTGHSDPYVATVITSTTPGNQASTLSFDGEEWRSYDSGFGGLFQMYMVAPARMISGSVAIRDNTVGASAVEDFDNEYWFVTTGLMGSDIGVRGPKGRMVDFFLCQGSIFANGDTFPTGGGKQFIVIGDILYPWDGVTNLETA